MVRFKTIESCTISNYMAASFEDNLAAICNNEEENTQEEQEAALWAINVEFSELSGEETNTATDLIRQYYSLQARITAVSVFIDVVKQSVIHFGKPFPPAIEQLRKFGHKIKSENSDEMLKELAKFEVSEKRYLIQLDDLKFRIEKEQKEAPTERNDIKQSRRNFLELLNALASKNCKIDKEKTTMEELALMVKAYKEYLINHQKDKK